MALEHTSERPPPKPQRRMAMPAPREVHFPSEEPFEEHVAETKRHLEARTTLYLALVEERKHITIGSDQFLYFDADDPKKCLAPDVFVKVDATIKDFDSWMIWERGAPQLAVEIVSNSDRLNLAWEEKFERYEATEIEELVRFDPRSQPSLRVWDRIDGRLFERVPNRSGTYECKTLGLYWTVEMTAEYGRQLRLARDRKGKQTLPTPSEVNVQLAQQLADERHARSLAEHARLLAEQKQCEEAQARLLAEHKQREEAQARLLAEHKQQQAEQKQREEAQAHVRAQAVAATEIERLRAEIERLRGSAA